MRGAQLIYHVFTSWAVLPARVADWGQRCSLFVVVVSFDVRSRSVDVLLSVLHA